jgi:hypothetical protein
MRKGFRICVKIIFLLFTVYLVYINFKLDHQPTFNEDNLNIDVQHQLKYLKTRMHNGAALEMQSLFPEGFLFLNALYTLSWCNLISNQDELSNVYKEGIEEVEWTIKEIESEEGIAIFPSDLPLPHGAYYRGWLNYCLGQKIKVEKGKNASDNAKFKKNCSAIKSAIINSETPFLESYYSQCWPADMTACIASLNLHDQLFNEEYKETIDSWINEVKLNLDSVTGLIPHAVYPFTGEPRTIARGSSQSLSLYFLSEIDHPFVAEQFTIYQELFKDCRFGLTGIREYPKGSSGMGDVDSGPVLLGIGGAASIVGQATFLKFNDLETSNALRQAIEAFGIGFCTDDSKNYLLGALPMADAFIVWSNSLYKSQKTPNSKWIFHLITIALICMLILIIFKW